ncbi:hypothetical protein ACMHYJ_05885 [Castellaniella hirudinis]|uniref:hypothetical protein n=1 Tax=Castellaniella hirudinis TaxID=1144617 RepID=UPI0039C31B21
MSKSLISNCSSTCFACDCKILAKALGSLQFLFAAGLYHILDIQTFKNRRPELMSILSAFFSMPFAGNAFQFGGRPSNEEFFPLHHARFDYVDSNLIIGARMFHEILKISLKRQN